MIVDDCVQNAGIMVVEIAETRQMPRLVKQLVQQALRIFLALGTGDAQQFLLVRPAHHEGIEGLAKAGHLAHTVQSRLKKVGPGPHLGENHETAKLLCHSAAVL